MTISKIPYKTNTTSATWPHFSWMKRFTSSIMAGSTPQWGCQAGLPQNTTPKKLENTAPTLAGAVSVMSNMAAPAWTVRVMPTQDPPKLQWPFPIHFAVSWSIWLLNSKNKNFKFNSMLQYVTHERCLHFGPLWSDAPLQRQLAWPVSCPDGCLHDMNMDKKIARCSVDSGWTLKVWSKLIAFDLVKKIDKQFDNSPTGTSVGHLYFTTPAECATQQWLYSSVTNFQAFIVERRANKTQEKPPQRL